MPLLAPRTLALALFITLLAPRLAAARDPVKEAKSGFVADALFGVAVPIGNDDHVDYSDASFKFALRLGYEFRLPSIFGVAPELALDLSPVNLDDDTFPNGGRVTRVRGLGGARLFFHFPIGYAYVRLLFGVDHVTGSVPVIGSLRADLSSTGFGFAPELGVSFRLWRFLHAGVQLAFPVGLFDFGEDPFRSKFTGVDLDFLATIGVHL